MDIPIENLLRELAQAAGIPEPLLPGEFTVKMFMATNQLTEDVARSALERLERDGHIESVGERVYEGRRFKAYRKVAL
jgi:hypothetical protein